MQLQKPPIAQPVCSGPQIKFSLAQVYEVAACIQGSARKVFDFSKKCTVLILDRSGDAVTPLLTPWTYEAMLHELIPGGIVDNTVAVRAETGVVSPLPTHAVPSSFFSRFSLSLSCVDARNVFPDGKSLTRQ